MAKDGIDPVEEIATELLLERLEAIEKDQQAINGRLEAIESLLRGAVSDTPMPKER